MSEATAEVSVETDAPERVPLSRREFLNYLWAMSMAVAMAGSGGLAIWFLVPRFREGEFGGVFIVPINDIPAPDTPPKEFPEGRFWLSNIGQASLDDERRPGDYPLESGVRAIYKVCTHLGCLYKWVESNDRFECPCHGSKFLSTGTRIDGPARRNLDVFPIEVVDASGNVLVRTEPALNNNEGTPVMVPSDAVELRVDTGRRITGGPSSEPGGGF
jgi:cytochrome b6-f complex iron-sulfur subunit